LNFSMRQMHLSSGHIKWQLTTATHCSSGAPGRGLSIKFGRLYHQLFEVRVECSSTFEAHMSWRSKVADQINFCLSSSRIVAAASDRMASIEAVS
jgi:hypothetical protein